MTFDPYALLVAFSISLVFLTTYFTLIPSQKTKTPQIASLLFIFGSFALLLLFSKLLGSFGAWIAFDTWQWGPSSILGFLALEVLIWRKWASKQGKVGELLLKRWSFCSPWAQALGRMGCFIAGCCYIQRGIPLNWPFLEGIFLVLLGALLFLSAKYRGTSPTKLFDTYLVASLSARFILEFWRGDFVRGTWAVLSFPQLICLLLLTWLFLDLRREKYHNSGA